MEQPKRGRGRPRGASRLNQADDQILIKVADIVEAEAIAPSTAMHRCGYMLESAGLRRLQRKWKGKRDWYLAEARRQAAARAEAVRASYARHIPVPAEMLGITAQMKAFQDKISPSIVRTAEQMAVMSAKWSGFAGPHYASAIAAFDSPTLKALQTAQLTARALQPHGLHHLADITISARQFQGAISSITAMRDGSVSLRSISKAYG